jgi:hypothetical protein
MTDDNIRAAWERFHGPIPELDGYIPATPPTYSQGYRDGAESIAAEICSALDQLDHLANVWGDEGVFRTCRDRLRALVTP